jgi:hypothetical protein
MSGDLDDIHGKTPVQQLDTAFADTSGAMKDALRVLRQPQTGKPADDAEGKTIDSLSDLINLINEQAQRASPQPSPGESGSSDEEMQFLMQMARNAAKGKAFATQPNRGLSSPGGSATRAGGPPRATRPAKAPRRAVNQAAGVIENAPAEFRDALENYYHGLEKSKE